MENVRVHFSQLIIAFSFGFQPRPAIGTSIASLYLPVFKPEDYTKHIGVVCLDKLNH